MGSNSSNSQEQAFSPDSDKYRRATHIYFFIHLILNWGTQNEAPWATEFEMPALYSGKSLMTFLLLLWVFLPALLHTATFMLHPG